MHFSILAKEMEQMNNNTIRIFTEKFENEQTGEKVDGVTIMIDGKLKQVLDVIINKEGKYSNYIEVIKDILFSGVNNYISNK